MIKFLLGLTPLTTNDYKRLCAIKDEQIAYEAERADKAERKLENLLRENTLIKRDDYKHGETVCITNLRELELRRNQSE